MPDTIESILTRVENLIVKQLKNPEKPIELTDEDKFAFAFVAGVEMNFQQEYDKVKVTSVPCGVIWDGIKFCVFTK